MIKAVLLEAQSPKQVGVSGGTGRAEARRGSQTRYSIGTASAIGAAGRRPAVMACRHGAVSDGSLRRGAGACRSIVSVTSAPETRQKSPQTSAKSA
ncbi:hypothetical protein D3272_21230 [Lichenibacterium ramalinae]|uniref:Uncharacterized protein n=1 Tax=Lichenibacterium ramalinae TaxID=2316527 RepID=A0A4Q2R771_9HYPH|nr:hypothetical protein D3272_21230 [Lichenibacterium ramalinae]